MRSSVKGSAPPLSMSQRPCETSLARCWFLDHLAPFGLQPANARWEKRRCSTLATRQGNRAGRSWRCCVCTTAVLLSRLGKASTIATLAFALGLRGFGECHRPGAVTAVPCVPYSVCSVYMHILCNRYQTEMDGHWTRLSKLLLH